MPKRKTKILKKTKSAYVYYGGTENSKPTPLKNSKVFVNDKETMSRVHIGVSSALPDDLLDIIMKQGSDNDGPYSVLHDIGPEIGLSTKQSVNLACLLGCSVLQNLIKQRRM